MQKFNQILKMSFQVSWSNGRNFIS